MQPHSKKNNEQDEQEKNEKEAESKYGPFHPSLFEAKDAEKAISLLQSKEKSVLLTAIEALSKYASRSKENVKILFDLGIVHNVLAIIEHEDIFIRRFAAKLLTEMTTMPDVTIYLIEFDYLPYFTKLLMNEKDTFMQEYFSAMLVRLSKDPYGTALLAKHCTDMNFLFEMIQSSEDPDVKRNNIEILYNLMQDPVAACKISKTEKFSFPLLYQHFESSYPEIQYLALTIVADMIGRNKDEGIQSLFRETNGVKTLLNFLENDEWNDFHIKALRILHFATENPAIVDELIDGGNIPQILNYIEHAANPELHVEAFRIIVNVANTSNGRQVLHSCEIIEYLIDALCRSTQSDIIEIICYGIGKMTLFNHAAQELARREAVKTILSLLKKEDLQWSARHAAGFALKQLLMSDIGNCNIFSNIHGQDYLLQLMKQFVEQVPMEICIIVLEILLAIARHLTFRDTLINPEIIDIICSLLESTYPLIDEFKITCCNLLSVLCLEKNGRHYFLEANGPRKLYTLITDAHPISVKNAAVQLVQTISTDLIVGKAFIENNYLAYMLNNRSSSRVIPLWDTCIDTLFKSHLPMKFALTGRLSLHDLTQDGFYAFRTSICPFPVLDDFFRYKFCPLEPVYVVNCIQSSTPSTQIDTLQTTFEENINAWFDLKSGQLRYDPYFTEYVEVFKRMIVATEPKDTATNADMESMNIQRVLSRAKMLARFVARQMSGFDSGASIDHQLEVHLKEIKERLETNVIPLGQLRAGSYLERALLFKAIADRICLPAALVRGEYGVSWVEITIPKIEDSCSDEQRLLSTNADKKNANSQEVIISDSSESVELIDKSYITTHRNEHNNGKISSSRGPQSIMYPTKLIRPNFIINLMDISGDLIPIE